MKTKAKGYRAERQLVQFFKDKGIEAYRVPLSGASYLKADVVVRINDKEYLFEVKNQERLRGIYKYPLPVLFTDNYVALMLEDLYEDVYDIRRLAISLPATIKRVVKQAERESALLVIKASRQKFVVVGQYDAVLDFIKAVKEGI